MLIEAFMLLLTTGVSGNINGAFAAQESVAACNDKLPAIVSTVEAAGSPVLRSGCVQANWPFSAFTHDRAEGPVVRHHYLVDFSTSNTPQIQPFASAILCNSAKQQAVAIGGVAGEVFCVTSAQSWGRL